MQSDSRMRSRTVALFVALIAALVVPVLLAAATPTIARAETETFNSLQDLDGKRIGVQTGSTFDVITKNRLPNAKIEYYNTYADMAEAVVSNKIEGFPADEPVLKMIAAENPKIRILDERLESFEFGAIFPKSAKGDALKKEIDQWIAQAKTSGELDQLTKKWTEQPESERTMPDYESLPAPKGTLVMATDGGYPPMTYFRDSKLVGMELDLAAQFCESAGYGLKVDIMNFDGILPAVQSEKVDFGLSGFTITEERKEGVNFSEPYYLGGTVMAVRAEAAGAGEAANPIDGIGESFSKTFVRENRWKMFLDGVITTLMITILSIVLGTVLGFVVFVLCRNGGRIANGISGACMWLLQGMPGVVLLMILYYIVFGSFSIGGVAVSVVGFTLTFGTTVFGLLKTGVGAVDGGQGEAASALGYSEHQTFFKIILPQALPHVMPPYKGEVVNLIKATSIVGYIAVQDLTKMGDIVRSRTYEAFFPLIAITIIYFALEGLLGFVVGRIQISFDPKRRSKDVILKGVKTDD